MILVCAEAGLSKAHFAPRLESPGAQEFPMKALNVFAASALAAFGIMACGPGTDEEDELRARCAAANYLPSECSKYRTDAGDDPDKPINVKLVATSPNGVVPDSYTLRTQRTPSDPGEKTVEGCDRQSSCTITITKKGWYEVEPKLANYHYVPRKVYVTADTAMNWDTAGDCGLAVDGMYKSRTDGRLYRFTSQVKNYSGQPNGTEPSRDVVLLESTYVKAPLHMNTWELPADPDGGSSSGFVTLDRTTIHREYHRPGVLDLSEDYDLQP